jgi:predicted metal-dependent phosphoesterase TrpH
MNRRSFLKSIAGFSIAAAGAQLAIPISAKCKMVAPITELVGKTFLDRRIQDGIYEVKRANPYLKIGETHCHSIFSDGTYSVDKIMARSAKLGLDFLVITEHVQPGKFPLEKTLESIKERNRCCEEWSHPGLKPIEVYPGFEVSTSQGHLILVMDQDYLKPKNLREIKTQFSVFDKKYISMEDCAKMVKPFGGVSIIAHPERTRTTHPFGVSIPFAQQNLTGLVDAIEDISTGHSYEENYSEELGMASIGSSDDHFNLIIGTTVTGYDSRKHKNLLSAIQARDTQAIKVNDSLDDLLGTARLVLNA